MTDKLRKKFTKADVILDERRRSYLTRIQYSKKDPFVRHDLYAVNDEDKCEAVMKILQCTCALSIFCILFIIISYAMVVMEYNYISLTELSTNNGIICGIKLEAPFAMKRIVSQGIAWNELIIDSQLVSGINANESRIFYTKDQWFGFVADSNATTTEELCEAKEFFMENVYDVSEDLKDGEYHWLSQLFASAFPGQLHNKRSGKCCRYDLNNPLSLNMDSAQCVYISKFEGTTC